MLGQYSLRPKTVTAKGAIDVRRAFGPNAEESSVMEVVVRFGEVHVEEVEARLDFTRAEALKEVVFPAIASLIERWDGGDTTALDEVAAFVEKTRADVKAQRERDAVNRAEAQHAEAQRLKRTVARAAKKTREAAARFGGSNSG